MRVLVFRIHDAGKRGQLQQLFGKVPILLRKMGGRMSCVRGIVSAIVSIYVLQRGYLMARLFPEHLGGARCVLSRQVVDFFAVEDGVA